MLITVSNRVPPIRVLWRWYREIQLCPMNHEAKQRARNRVRAAIRLARSK